MKALFSFCFRFVFVFSFWVLLSCFWLLKMASENAAGVYIVTGSNQGIGLCIVEQLWHKLPKEAVVILTSRSVPNGEQAREGILASSAERAANGPSIVVQQLDLTDAGSIARFSEFLAANHPVVRVLINNAAIAFKGDAFDEHVAKTTFAPNYHGTIALTAAVLPFLDPSSGTVITVGSRAGLLSRIPSQELRDRLSSPSLTQEGLDQIVTQFISSVADGTYADKGWHRSAYGISKTAIHAHFRILARAHPHLLFYIVCPGWCKTSMAGDKAPLTAAQGASCPVWLATQPRDLSKSGTFWAGDFTKPSDEFNEIQF